jgi:hypothetical protein
MANARRIRLCIVLPSVFFVLAVVMTLLGEHRYRSEYEQVIQQRGHVHEAIATSAATERFVDYAINAPAWVAAWRIMDRVDTVSFIPEPIRPRVFGKIMRGDRNYLYFIFLVLMWVGIGRTIDGVSQRGLKVFAHWYFALYGVLSVCYGYFMFATPGYYWNRDIQAWLFLSVRIWGIALMGSGIGIIAVFLAKRRAETEVRG